MVNDATTSHQDRDLREYRGDQRTRRVPCTGWRKSIRVCHRGMTRRRGVVSKSTGSTPPPATFSTITAGRSHTCGSRDDGTVTCWEGLVRRRRHLQRRVDATGGDVDDDHAGHDNTCGLRIDGTATRWGKSLAMAVSVNVMDPSHQDAQSSCSKSGRTGFQTIRFNTRPDRYSPDLSVGDRQRGPTSTRACQGGTVLGR